MKKCNYIYNKEMLKKIEVISDSENRQTDFEIKNYCEEIDCFQRNINNKSKKLHNLNKNTFRELIFSNKKIPDKTKNKINYWKSTFNIISTDEELAGYLLKNNMDEGEKAIKNKSNEGTYFSKFLKAKKLERDRSIARLFQERKQLNNFIINQFVNKEHLPSSQNLIDFKFEDDFDHLHHYSNIKNSYKTNTSKNESNNNSNKLKFENEVKLRNTEESYNLNKLMTNTNLRLKTDPINEDESLLISNNLTSNLNININSNGKSNLTENLKIKIDENLKKIEEYGLKYKITLKDELKKSILKLQRGMQISKNITTEKHLETNNNLPNIHKNETKKGKIIDINDFQFKVQQKNKKYSNEYSLKDKNVRDLVYDISSFGHFGPYASFCNECNKKNINFYNNIEKQTALNILNNIKISNPIKNKEKKV